MGFKEIRKKQRRNNLKNYLGILFIAFLSSMFLRQFVVSVYKIPTSAMLPNLKAGDFIFANKLAFIYEKPKVGDVVIFACPKDKSVSCIKRIVAQGGESLEIRQGRLIKDGKAFQYKTLNLENYSNILGYQQYRFFEETSENYKLKVLWDKVKNHSSVNFGPIEILSNKFFVLGDNRYRSEGSLDWGSIPLEDITAKASFIWLSLDWNKTWGKGTFPSIRWNRVFSKIK